METTVCIRCGKPRILAKSWTHQEKASGAKLMYVQTVCPDKECQKLVEKELKKRQEKLMAIQAQALERRKHMGRTK